MLTFTLTFTSWRGSAIVTFHRSIFITTCYTTVGLPGSGMSYTHYERYPNSTNAASNTIPFTPTCPRCGHHMRKAWANCPKCNYNLLPAASAPPPPTDTGAPEEGSSAAGCGCLLVIILMIAFAIYIV